jgi:glucose uptake protein GlcU
MPFYFQIIDGILTLLTLFVFYKEYQKRNDKTKENFTKTGLKKVLIALVGFMLFYVTISYLICNETKHIMVMIIESSMLVWAFFTLIWYLKYFEILKEGHFKGIREKRDVEDN